MKSFQKKCRGCLWAGPCREEGLEAVPAVVLQAPDLVPEVLGRSGGMVKAKTVLYGAVSIK